MVVFHSQVKRVKSSRSFKVVDFGTTGSHIRTVQVYNCGVGGIVFNTNSMSLTADQRLINVIGNATTRMAGMTSY